jgi:hypothetical protein
MFNLLDLIKGYIGEHIAHQLVHLAYSENIEISVSAAKLLRSITVNSMLFCPFFSMNMCEV